MISGQLRAAIRLLKGIGIPIDKDAKGYLHIDKSQISSTKLQLNLKFKYSIIQAGLRFCILVILVCPSTWLRVVVSLSNHWTFSICYLEFKIFYELIVF
jgi:hypothetical protein